MNIAICYFLFQYHTTYILWSFIGCSNFRLRSSGLAIKFVTNTTKESSRILHSRLESLGFSVTREEIYSSLGAARRLADERKLNPLLLVDAAAAEDFEGLSSNNDKYDSVLVGLAPDKFDYSHLNQAFR